MSTSRSLNKVMLIGNLTRNPVLKSTTGGATVCTFGIATNTTWKDGEGNLQERTEFHNIVAWNKLGEICAQILSTGMLVYVEGELRTRVWDDENGTRHYRTEIKIEDMKLLDNKGREPVGIDNAKNGASEEDHEEASSRENKPAEKKEASKKALEEKESEEDSDEDSDDDDRVDEEEINKDADDLF